MSNINQPSFDRIKFMTNFQGIEDLAIETINSFLESLPQLVLALETAIHKMRADEIELAAHTLKGAISNFYAEPAQLAAWKLEHMSHGSDLPGMKVAFSNLKIELVRLERDFRIFLSERKAA